MDDVNFGSWIFLLGGLFVGLAECGVDAFGELLVGGHPAIFFCVQRHEFFHISK